MTVPAGLEPARVFAQHRGACAVVAAGGERLATLAGRLFHESQPTPAVGDWVGLAEGDVIAAVLPRGGVLRRADPGGATEPQVLAANVDTALIVSGLDRDLNARRIERWLALALDGGVAPLLVLSKADLHPDPDAVVAEWTARTGELPVLAISTPTGGGLDALGEHLAPGRTAVLLGSSGAGKSTLVNALLGEDRQATAPVRVRDDRGRHTTTRRELIVLPSGALLIDTPGLRLPRLWEPVATEGGGFADIERLAQGCRFADCRHDREPGCAVRGQVEPERLRHWAKLESERMQIEERRGRAGRR
jgi:ribosome biogenesis GTPase / thiamine phosphate phosphatase